ncbi:MAG: hypothetical protein K1X89_28415 [Myxococcaceae bacterium]|nr:hypothetical protein [Myxococcaceae bacterium]
MIAVLLVLAAAPLDAEAYEATVRPMLVARGCAAGNCHGSELLPFVLPPPGRPGAPSAIAHAVAGKPGASPLLQRALGQGHFVGRMLEPGSCEAKVIEAWIAGAPLKPCAAAAGPDRRLDAPAPPLSAELAKPLAGCASERCHGAGGAAPTLLDLDRPGALEANASVLWRFAHPVKPFRSPLMQAVLGSGKHPRVFDGVDDPGARALAGWMLRATIPARGPQRYADFAARVEPVLEARGCASASCHAGRTEYQLLEGQTEDNYWRTLSVAADGRLLSKGQNRTAHGGGRRLGGAEDCAAATVRAWSEGRPVPDCRPPEPPSFEVFRAVVVPGLSALTCTKCHRKGPGGFWAFDQPDEEQLQRSYRSTLEHATVDFPMASSVLQRVREKCLQRQMTAWLSRVAPPKCTVDVSNFEGTFPKMATPP